MRIFAKEAIKNLRKFRRGKFTFTISSFFEPKEELKLRTVPESAADPYGFSE